MFDQFKAILTDGNGNELLPEQISHVSVNTNGDAQVKELKEMMADDNGPQVFVETKDMSMFLDSKEQTPNESTAS